MNSISKKVLLGYLLVLVVAIVASITLFGVATEVNKRTEQFIGETLPELDDIQHVKQSLDAIQIASYSLYGTIIDGNKFAEVLKKNKKLLNQLLNNKGKGTLSTHPEHVPITNEIKSLLSAITSLESVMTADAIDWDAARDILVGVDQYSNKVSALLMKVKDHVGMQANKSSKAITAEIANIQLLVLLLLASIIIVAVVAYTMSHQKIALPIRELANELDNVAQNYDLTTTVPQHSKDEIGIAAESVNQLIKAFNKGITDVRDVANSINGLVENLGLSSENADVQVKILNERIELLVSSMMTLEGQIAEGFHQSNNASEKAKLGAKEVEEGAQQVAKTSSSISSLARDLEASSEMLLKLHKSGDQVSGVVSTIASIADQTNLLALNAAIEAARAGESGRGFAVVADEVRSLATRTHQSTIEINDMLEGIVSSISKIVASMADNQVQADQAVELSEETVDSLSSLHAIILKLSTESAEVATQAENSHTQVVDMRNWVEDFKTVGDAVCEGSMETRNTSLKMTELAFSFNQSVERFKT